MEEAQEDASPRNFRFRLQLQVSAEYPVVVCHYYCALDAFQKFLKISSIY